MLMDFTTSPIRFWMRFDRNQRGWLLREIPKLLSRFGAKNCVWEAGILHLILEPGGGSAPRGPPENFSMSDRAKSVLIVDDGPLLRQKLSERLRREGDFDVCGEAGDGQEAIEKAQQLQPDLIIMDLSMPKMNGLDAVRILRKLIPSI